MTLLRLSLRNIRRRFVVFIFTALAVILGVAFVVGTFVITDALRETFDNLAEDIGGTIDYQVRAAPLLGEQEDAPPIDPDLVDVIAGVDGVAAVEGSVREFNVNPLDADGEELDGQFPKIGFSWTADAELAQLYLVEDGESAAPGDGEFVINSNAAEDFDYVIGGSYIVELPATGPQQLRLSGVFNFADPTEDQALAVLSAFPLEYAVDALNGGEGYDTILVDVDNPDDPGIRSAIQSAINDSDPSQPIEVVTSEEITEETSDDFGEILTIFQSVLLGFAFVILVVSAFLIYNTFTIVIGQRIQELGLMRALGATGAQVTTMIVVEALIIGIISTILGLFAGLGLGNGLLKILDSLGFGPPTDGAGLTLTTVAVGALIGVGVTVVSATMPALRARRIPPIAALRDGARLGEFTPTRNVVRALTLLAGAVVLILLGALGGYGTLALSCLVASILVFQGGRRIHPLIGRFGVMFLGLGLVGIGIFADLETGTILSLLGVGAILIFVGVNLVSPTFAEPVTRLIGGGVLAVVFALVALGFGVATIYLFISGLGGLADGEPINLLLIMVFGPLMAGLTWIIASTAWAKRGTESTIGTRNAGRSPRRTSATAAALMIGLALVSMVTVLGSSLKKTISDTLDNSIAADWFVSSGNGGPGSGFSHEAVNRLHELTAGGPLESVISYRFRDEAFAIDEVVTSDGITTYNAVDDHCDVPPCDLDTISAMSARMDILDQHLDPDFVDRDASLDAEDAIWIHEDSATDRNISVGDSALVTFADEQGETLTVSAIYSDATILGNWTVDQDIFDAHIAGDLDDFASAVTADGVSEDEARSGIEEATAGFASLNVQDREEFQQANEQQIDDVLNIVSVLLGLSVLIAFFGITITLTLSVFERTRELGLLRAVGLQQGQTRRMIRWEGAIIAVFGGILGVTVGVLFGWAATVVIPKSIIADFDIPFTQLAIFTVIAGIAGVVASLWPAWRATRLDVLDAISSE